MSHTEERTQREGRDKRIRTGLASESARSIERGGADDTGLVVDSQAPRGSSEGLLAGTIFDMSPSRLVVRVDGESLAHTATSAATMTTTSRTGSVPYTGASGPTANTQASQRASHEVKSPQHASGTLSPSSASRLRDDDMCVFDGPFKPPPPPSVVFQASPAAIRAQIEAVIAAQRDTEYANRLFYLADPTNAFFRQFSNTLEQKFYADGPRATYDKERLFVEAGPFTMNCKTFSMTTVPEHGHWYHADIAEQEFKSQLIPILREHPEGVDTSIPVKCFQRFFYFFTQSEYLEEYARKLAEPPPPALFSNNSGSSPVNGSSGAKKGSVPGRSPRYSAAAAKAQKAKKKAAVITSDSIATRPSSYTPSSLEDEKQAESDDISAGLVQAFRGMQMISAWTRNAEAPDYRQGLRHISGYEREWSSERMFHYEEFRKSSVMIATGALEKLLGDPNTFSTYPKDENGNPRDVSEAELIQRFSPRALSDVLDDILS